MTKTTEIQLQSQIFQWAWNTHPETRRLLFAVPNGGYRNKIEATQLKASGMVAGIPDMLFVWKGRVHAFELKTASGILSPAQSEVHKVWNPHCSVHVIRDIQTFQSIFKSIIQQQ